MDSRTTSPLPPDALAAMLQNASIDTAESSEFSNTARDTFRFVLNYNPNIRSAVGPENGALEFHDAMNYLLNAVPLVLEEVRKNDQSRSTTAQTIVVDTSDPIAQVSTTDNPSHPESFILEDPVDVIDIVPPEPSLLPVTSIADRYTRSMLKCLVGYPLYNPKPFCELSNEYERNGVSVGDVGFVRDDGTFDFLFNICLSPKGSINPQNLPDGFSLEASDHSIIRELEPLPRNTCFFPSPVSKAKSGEYTCEGAEGAVLELPDGAIGGEATNMHPFELLATRHGIKWYEYTIARGRKVSNGSLYLITSFTKCAQWGVAIFDRPCAPGQGLRFEKKRSPFFGKSTSKYQWKGTCPFFTKVSNPDQIDGPNQCVFVRGYKIMIRQDIFDELCKDQLRRLDSATTSSSPQSSSINMTRQRAMRIRGGSGPDLLLRVTGGIFSGTNTFSILDQEVVLHSDFSSSLVHPSDLINAALLSQYPGAKVAVTHDDVWCDLLRDNFPKLDRRTLINTAQSYATKVDRYGTRTGLTKDSYLIRVLDCISLEKISEAFQKHSLKPENDVINLPTTVSLNLPSELMERILLLLDTESILTCRLVDKAFNQIIQSSTILQYFLACKAAGVVDSPRSPLSYAERLEALKRWQEAWRNLKPVFETTIQVSNQIGQTSSFYELAAGNYFLSDNDRKDLYCCRLPSSSQDNPKWTRIPGDGPGQTWSGYIAHIVTAIYEHDLMVNVTFSEVGNQAEVQRYSLDLILLKFSTGEYHPLACRPRIHVQRSDSTRPFVNTRIVGDNIALIVGSYRRTFREKLFIFNWKTGHKRLQHETTEDAYSGLVFLSPELLLVPNYALFHFEVWYLPCSDTDPNPPTQILALRIPAISDHYSITSIYCHGEPSPFLISMPYFPPRPFFSAPEDSIITFNFRFSSSLIGHGRRAYALIMHRRALLDTIQKWTSPSFLEQDPQSWSTTTNEVFVNQVTDPDDGSVRLSAQSMVVSTHDVPSGATHQLSPSFPITAGPISSPISSGSSTAPSASRYDITKVQWTDWGPPISRWFQLDESQSWRIHRSTGQRYVFLTPSHQISVADFNPHNVRRNAAVMQRLKMGEMEDSGNSHEAHDEGKSREIEKESEILDDDTVFSEEVCMGLKCVVSDLQGEYDFDAVLINEERLLGLKVDLMDRVESVKVIYIG